MFTTDNADSNVRTEVTDVLGVNNYENCLLSLFPHCNINFNREGAFVSFGHRYIPSTETIPGG